MGNKNNEKVEVEVVSEKEVNSTSKSDINDRKDDKVIEADQKEPKQGFFSSMTPQKKKYLWTASLVLVMAVAGIVILAMNKCSKDDATSSSVSSADYSPYIEKSSVYKQKLLQIANEYVDILDPENTSEDFNEIYAYSYNESNLVNSKLLYTVANDTEIAFISIDGFDRETGDDYETIISNESTEYIYSNHTITCDITARNNTYEVPFKNDEQFVSFTGENSDSLKYVVANTSTPDTYVTSYSYYNIGNNVLCSVNSYTFNNSDNPFTTNNGLVTTFKMEQETLVFFLFE